MGRPPSNGGPSFRFLLNEVTEMEAVLQEYHNTMPAREVLVTLAQKFSESPDRKGKIQVQMKQVWNWFQNRRYAIRAKSNKSPMKLNITPMIRDDSATARGVSQQVAAPIPGAVPATMPVSSAAGAGRATSENFYMEFEAKSARDGAWYDVGTFLSHRYLDKGDPEVLVRFAGFGPDEDEWLNVRKFVRQRSLPCEASECVAVLPADLILCFQEGKDQALYFDAHVLDAQRRRHDVRGCRCRFLVRYDHDQSEEIVPLRKICRRPETDYRLLQLHSASDTAAGDQKKTSMDPLTANAQRVAASAAETTPQQQHNAVAGPAAPVSLANVPQQHNAGVGPAAPVSLANVPQPAKTIFAEPKKAETPSAVSTGNLSFVSSAGFPSVTSTATALASGTAQSSSPGGSGENKQGIIL